MRVSPGRKLAWFRLKVRDGRICGPKPIARGTSPGVFPRDPSCGGYMGGCAQSMYGTIRRLMATIRMRSTMWHGLVGLPSPELATLRDVVSLLAHSLVLIR